MIVVSDTLHVQLSYAFQFVVLLSCATFWKLRGNLTVH